MASTNIKIHRGVTFRKKLLIRDAANNAVDLTGYTAVLRMYLGKTTLATITTPALDNTGIIIFGLAAINTTGFLPTYSSASYQVLLKDSVGTVKLLLSGEIQIYD